MKNLKLFSTSLVAALSLSSAAFGAAAPDIDLQIEVAPDIDLQIEAAKFIIAIQTDNLEEVQRYLGRPDIYNAVIDDPEITPKPFHVLEFAITTAVSFSIQDYISEVTEAILAMPNFETLRRNEHSKRCISVMFMAALKEQFYPLIKRLLPQMTASELQPALQMALTGSLSDITWYPLACKIMSEIERQAKANPTDDRTQKIFRWSQGLRTDIERLGRGLDGEGAAK